ncbi:MAG: hypothetical protein CPDRYMAC_5812 [uncultured Paraburkholderia sp.]|nr:MAG: hypothetical protein CPDRYDRY_5755 [uncultured Paraburkholderia sp.]CAH2942614.1 MAG: hypothetical protein CPDRYMAC_5812 [uncultured Paraburkholderia sp.]
MSHHPLLTRRAFVAGVSASLAAATLPLVSRSVFAAPIHTRRNFASAIRRPPVR